jgi:hypothetical protein
MSTINRMRLDEVVSWFSQHGYKQTASYFMSLVKDECTILYDDMFWIDTKTIHDHLGDRLFRKLECDVCTWILTCTTIYRSSKPAEVELA